MSLSSLPRILSATLRRSYSSSFNRPAPIPLPPDQQREFELLQRAAQAPLVANSGSSQDADDSLQLHPDARKPLKPDFEGDINPKTGEQGGPKQEPVGHWIEGDWSFKGRVSDF